MERVSKQEKSSVDLHGVGVGRAVPCAPPNGRQQSAVPTKADYWIQTVAELRHEFIGARKIDNALVNMFLEYCADPTWWTQTIAFTAVHGWAPVE